MADSKLSELRSTVALLVRCLSFLDLITLFKFGRMVMSKRQWAMEVVAPYKRHCAMRPSSAESIVHYTVLIENNSMFMRYFHSKIVPLVLIPSNESLLQEVNGASTRLLAPFETMSIRVDMQHWQQKNVNLITPHLMQQAMNFWRDMKYTVIGVEVPMCDKLGWNPSNQELESDSPITSTTQWIQCLRDHRKGITSLNLSGCNIVDSMLMDDNHNPIARNGVSVLSSLRDLNLSFNAWISDMGMEHVKTLAGLQSLDLSFTAVSDKGLYSLKSLFVLEQLHLMGTRITSNGLGKLFSGNGPSKIKRLNLFGCSLSDLNFLQPITSSLEALSISWRSNTNAGKSLSLIASLPRLKELIICDIGEWGAHQFRILFGKTGMPQLETISLRMKSIKTGEEQSCMKMLSSCRRIKHFDLHIDELDLIKSRCLLHLAQLLGNPRLQHCFLKSGKTSSEPSDIPLDTQIRELLVHDEGKKHENSSIFELRHLSIISPGLHGITMETIAALLKGRPALEEICIAVRSDVDADKTTDPSVNRALKSLQISRIDDVASLYSLLKTYGNGIERLSFTENESEHSHLTGEALEECIIGCCPDLVELCLIGCTKLTDSCIHRLKRLIHLRQLSLENMEQLTVKAILPLGNSMRNLVGLKVPGHLERYVQKLNAICISAIVHT